MACPAEPEEFAPKEDLRVESLSKKSNISPNLKERPLSPVLTGGSVNRKFLIGRRLRPHKSRVRLSDRFKESEKKPENPSEIILSDVNISEFINDSLSSSQNENLINQLEKLEKLENKRNDVYKLLVKYQKSESSELCFKKPDPPPLNKVKKIKVLDKDSTNLNVTKSEYDIGKPKQFSNLCESAPVVPPKCSSFQTAAGKKIAVSEQDLQKHSKLFEDIITDHPLHYNVERKKKYTFLSKNKSIPTKMSNLEINIRPALTKSDASIQNLTDNMSNSIKSEFINTPIEGIKDAYSSTIKVSKRPSKCAKNIFSEENFNDVAVECRKVQTLKSESILKSNREISLTQEICESGISNTQMLCAVDNVLSSLEPKKEYKESLKDEFRGFNKTDIMECHNFLFRFNNVYKKLQRFSSTVQDNNERSTFSTIGKSNNSVVEGKMLINSKRLVDLPLPPKKRLRMDELRNTTNNWEPELEKGVFTSNFDSVNFRSASGKPIAVADSSLKKVKNIFDNIDLDLHITKLKEVKAKNSLPEIVEHDNVSLGGFSSASGKSISVSADSLKKARNTFDSLDLEPFKENLGKTSIASASSAFEKPNCKLEFFSKDVEFCKIENSRSAATALINKNSSMLPKYRDAIGRVKNVLETNSTCPDTSKHASDINFSITSGFQTAGGSEVKISEEALKKARQTYDKEQEENAPSAIPAEEANLTIKPRKKRLGISFCKQLQISDSKLEKAKLIFDEDLSKLSPIRPRYNNVYVSTPVGQNSTPIRNNMQMRQCNTSTPVGQTSQLTPTRNDLLKPSKSFSSFLEAASITPIKPSIFEKREVDIRSAAESKVVLMSPTKGNPVSWQSELEIEQRQLEERLRIVIERQKVMDSLLNKKPDENKRPREGILYKSKKSSARISLSRFVNNKIPGEEVTNCDLFDINAQNAENVHFKGLSSAVVTTKDGATIIPNLKDTISLSEIEIAFQAMPGVESRLIPSGWIRNHYKWIIWKLASYERMFPAEFSGCLCVEDVVQQLKYRYDREIDKAERSALRKIYEKDDAPQKRMVLCVSGIKEISSSQYEIELSDGWYMIRTVIDQPLCNQVARGKIRIGTKLVIFGAELLNCDGCYPLECTNLVCLRIGFNSARRAVWHARLGYQRNPEPFPIQVESIHPLGGPVGAIKVCVVRTYPFKFLERLEGRSVWRNKRAEEMRAQQWENERCKALEQIHEDARKEFENSHGKLRTPLGKLFGNSISDITCPETLCKLIESDEDSDCFQKLSFTQQAAVVEHQNNLTAKIQQEMQEKINESINRLKLSKRDVVGALKLLILDLNGSANRAFNFFLWRPNEFHTQMLREGTVVTIQNVLPKKNGDLYSCTKTMFKTEPPASYPYNNFTRRVTEIAELTQENVPDFNEFDTVGVVVQFTVDSCSQEVWLTNAEGRLLLITIYEGPSTCLLLDNLKRGQAVTVCNLVYRGIRDDIVQALANHFTVFSYYSKHCHLQRGLTVFKEELPKDVDNLISDCDKKIETFKSKLSSSKNDYSTNFEDSDDSTLISSRITNTDVALSLIDMDKFI